MKMILITMICTILLSCQDQKIEVPMDEEVMEETDNYAYLALGDSYTIGESVPESGRFPVQIVDSLQQRFAAEIDLEIIATTGWRTDQLLAATNAANFSTTRFDMVTLLIGVNNQFQGRSLEVYRKELVDLINLSIKLLDGKKENLILVSIPDWSVTPFGGSRDRDKTAEQIDLFNNVKKEVALEMNIRYVDITPISRANEEGLVASDGLHPSELQYAKWSSKILPEAVEVLNLQ